ncbi:hypothetical protein HHI36_015027 [Cryptolaemus montrouzieri]|uniref:Uncharacterized protein n=1 Tax=Cryptolaemus montrouzieri TaxID=559131 RepID=A0ABD2N4H4_9CUCU
MGCSTLCIVCRKTIGKSGYKIRCSGKCCGWAYITCTNIEREDILARKALSWTCAGCSTAAPSSSSDDSTDEDKVLEKLDFEVEQTETREVDEFSELRTRLKIEKHGSFGVLQENIRSIAKNLDAFKVNLAQVSSFDDCIVLPDIILFIMVAG